MIKLWLQKIIVFFLLSYLSCVYGAPISRCAHPDSRSDYYGRCSPKFDERLKSYSENAKLGLNSISLGVGSQEAVVAIINTATLVPQLFEGKPGYEYSVVFPFSGDFVMFCLSKDPFAPEEFRGNKRTPHASFSPNYDKLKDVKKGGCGIFVCAPGDMLVVFWRHDGSSTDKIVVTKRLLQKT